MTTVYLRALSYVLGEHIHSFEDATGYDNFLETNQISCNPDLWGWGQFHRTDDVFALAENAASNLLRKFDVAPESIDLVVFSSATFHQEPNTLFPLIGDLVQKLGCCNAGIKGDTLVGCASMLSSLNDVAEKIRNNICKNVLVIGLADTHPSSVRFTTSHIFSDASACCLLSAEGREGDIEFLDGLESVDLVEMRQGITFNPANAMHVKLADKLISENSVSRENLYKVLNNNLFLPLKRVKDALLKLKEEQIFTKNISRIGHCHACDPIINLADMLEGEVPPAGSNVVLQADGAGYSAMSLIRF